MMWINTTANFRKIHKIFLWKSDKSTPILGFPQFVNNLILPYFCPPQ